MPNIVTSGYAAIGIGGSGGAVGGSASSAIAIGSTGATGTITSLANIGCDTWEVGTGGSGCAVLASQDTQSWLRVAYDDFTHQWQTWDRQRNYTMWTAASSTATNVTYWINGEDITGGLAVYPDPDAYAYATPDAGRGARAEARQAARVRARSLLEMTLSPAEREEMAATRAFTVVGGRSGRRYRIRVDDTRHGNILELDEGGRAVRRYCVAPKLTDGAADIPDDDCFLGQKLFLEMDELEFLRKANVTTLLPVPQPAMPGEEALARGIIPPLQRAA